MPESRLAMAPIQPVVIGVTVLCSAVEIDVRAVLSLTEAVFGWKYPVKNLLLILLQARHLLREAEDERRRLNILACCSRRSAIVERRQRTPSKWCGIGTTTPPILSAAESSSSRVAPNLLAPYPPPRSSKLDKAANQSALMTEGTY